MKRFAWVVMFLSLGLFAYTGCGGPSGGGGANVEEDANIADMELQNMGGGGPGDTADEGGADEGAADEGAADEGAEGAGDAGAENP